MEYIIELYKLVDLEISVETVNNIINVTALITYLKNEE